VKVWLAHVLYGSGLMHLLKRVRLRRALVVLAYHRVLTSDAARQSWSDPAIVVSPATFERHLQVLQRAFRPLSVAEFERRLRRGEPFASGSCLVTFDDGWEDTVTHAWPLLQKYRVPAVVFMPADFIGTGRVFWQEQLGFLLDMVCQRMRAEPAFKSEAGETLAALGFQKLAIPNEGRGRQSIIDLVRARKVDREFDPESAIRRLKSLLESTEHHAAPDRMMTWADARQMASGGIAFGGHGASHRLLTRLTKPEIEREIDESLASVERELGQRPTSLSYPNGDWNEEVADIARRCGCTIAFSMDRGRVRVGDAPLSVRRVNIHEAIADSTPMFLARLLGLF
jgi:peptidoglycan/xylan/chitin deacetylase (PgdA/CDA1 family)